MVSKAEIESWYLYNYGSSNVNEIGMGLFLKSPWGDIVAYSICYEFKAINNEAGYEALFFGLKASEDLKNQQH